MANQPNDKIPGQELPQLCEHVEDLNATFGQLRVILDVIVSKSFYGPDGIQPNDPNYDELTRNVRCTEVFSRIYLGNEGAAKNKEYLRRIGVTHILNAAEHHVITGAEYYQDMDVRYLGYKLRDLDDFNISQYFVEAAEFIHEAISNLNGRILVHCEKGVSRSVALVIAYIVINTEMTVLRSLGRIKNLRRISPNDGFLRQLVKFEHQLKTGCNGHGWLV